MTGGALQRSDKLKFELPQYRYRAVRLEMVRAEVTSCQRALPAKLKFEPPAASYRAARPDAERAVVTNCQRRLAAKLEFEIYKEIMI